MQGAAGGILTFAGSRVAKFPISLSLLLFPDHLRTQLLPAWAALVSTDVQEVQECSPTVLGQTQKHVLFAESIALKSDLVQHKAQGRDNKEKRDFLPFLQERWKGYL